MTLSTIYIIIQALHIQTFFKLFLNSPQDCQLFGYYNMTTVMKAPNKLKYRAKLLIKQLGSLESAYLQWMPAEYEMLNMLNITKVKKPCLSKITLYCLSLCIIRTLPSKYIMIEIANLMQVSSNIKLKLFKNSDETPICYTLVGSYC